jgi:hypothetical protein
MGRVRFVAAFCSLVFLVSGCSSNNNSGNQKESDDASKVSGLFDGKCEDNQVWLADMYDSLRVGNWGTVFNLAQDSSFEDEWGIDYSTVFSDSDRMTWGISLGVVSRFINEGNYSGIERIYQDDLYPLMKKMDLACSVVTGKAALPDTPLG